MAETIPTEVVDLLKLVNNFSVHDVWTIEAFCRGDSFIHWRGRKLYYAYPEWVGLVNQYRLWGNKIAQQLNRIQGDYQVMVESQSRNSGIAGSLLVFDRPDIALEDPNPLVEMRREYDGWKIV